MEDLITHASILFDDRSIGVTSPVGSTPLPPAPAGQSAPNYAYGSSHTKVASVPAPIQTPTRQQVQQQPQSPEDFTPRLPPRPANSIHPSSRANPTSPTKSNMDPPPPPLPARAGQVPKGVDRVATPIPKPPPPEKNVPSVLKPGGSPEKAPAVIAPPALDVSAASTVVSTHEDEEQRKDAAVAATYVSVQDSAPPSPAPTPKSPQTPKFMTATLPTSSAKDTDLV